MSVDACLYEIIGQVSIFIYFFFQAEDGIRYLVRSRGLGDVYKRQVILLTEKGSQEKLEA